MVVLPPEDLEEATNTIDTARPRALTVFGQHPPSDFRLGRGEAGGERHRRHRSHRHPRLRPISRQM